MYRMLVASAVTLLVVASAIAHYPFLVPESSGASAKLIFSDSLAPDTMVNLDAIAATKLTLRDSKGHESTLECKKGEGFFTLDLPGSGTRVVYGVTEYGVLQVGETKPFKLVYYPKAVLGTTASKEAAIGEKLPLEIVPVSVFGKLKFQVLAGGKPLADAEVNVIPPQGKKKPVKTDKDGLTPEFDGHGRYGATAKQIQAKSGDFAGKKYEEVRNYATLVIDYER